MSSEAIEKIFDYDRLRKEINDPEPLAQCINIFTSYDREAIATQTKTRGPSFGVLELCNRIKKRGPEAVTQFIIALRKCEYTKLADETKANAKALNLIKIDDTERPIARGPIPRSVVNETTTPPAEESGHANHFLFQSVSAHNELESDNHSENDATSSSPVDQRGSETLLRDIPSQLKSEIVNSLNVECAMGNNWKGIAGEAKFTVANEQMLRSADSPMEELFTWMVQQNYHVSQLIEMLKNQKRYDVIDMIVKQGFAHKCEMEQHEQDTKEEDLSNRSHKLSLEATDKDDVEERELLSNPLSDIPEDNVFMPETIEGKALFIGIETYQNMTSLSKLNKQVFELASDIEYHGWNVIKNGRKGVLSAQIKDTASSYLENVRENDVCLVYLAGHTVQINGQNYLLSSEAVASSKGADIIDCSLNINKFVSELTRKALMVLLFVDGAHTNDADFDSDAVFTGLAPMSPAPNTIIAFPCSPGHTRSKEEMLCYVVEVKKVLDEQENVTPSMLFATLKQRIPSSVVFCLSLRSLFPLYITHNEESKPVIRKKLSETPQFGYIFYNDIETENEKNDAEHLLASLKQLGWKVEQRLTSEQQDVKQTIRQALIDLENDEVKVVMFYFIGFKAMDSHSLNAGEQRISITWLVNIMCEYICGPKAIVVDDSCPQETQTLELVTPLPQEVLLCLPMEMKTDNTSPTRDSFTLNLAQNMAQFCKGSLCDLITSTAQKCKQHKVNSNMFFA